MIKRILYHHLLEWKESPYRKPLLVRGARQVGKTTLVRQLGKEYAAYIELNLERPEDFRFFELQDAKSIFDAVCLQRKVNPEIGPILIFIDEIQESARAIGLMRYFYEDLPHVHVIGAGSLLEFALREVASFPVGRMDYLYLYPLNFQEYLLATGHEKLCIALKQIPVSAGAHQLLMESFHRYAMIGGMPEIVNRYFKDGNILQLSKQYKKLWQAFKDDFAKYAKNNSEQQILTHVINSVPHENDRIKFEKFGNSSYRSREVGDALRSLEKAYVVKIIHPITQTEPPASPDIKKRPRLQFIDTGMLVNILVKQIDLFFIKDLHELHRGKLMQQLITQELISIYESEEFTPSFWTREEKSGQAEVDLVYPCQNFLIPIEIKSGPQGRLRSLHQFIERCPHHFAIRMYAGKWNLEQHKTPGGKAFLLLNVPYYLGTRIPEISHWLIQQKMENTPIT